MRQPGTQNDSEATSLASSAVTRRSMQANRGQDRRPEVALRSALHRRGFRFRKHARPVPTLRCEADVVFPTERLAVLLDGCFWHGCPEHATRPATNAAWWATKLTSNVERDRRNSIALQEAGWRVVRIWEHEVVDDAVDLVVEVLGDLRRPIMSQPLRIVASQT